MKSILELSEVKAYRYFMESSNYCSLDLPKYINFSKVLTYVEEKVGKKSFDEILKDKNKKPSEYEVNPKVWTKNFGVYFITVVFSLFLCFMFIYVLYC